MTREEKAAIYAIRSLREAVRRIDAALGDHDLFSRDDYQENLMSLSAQIEHVANLYEFLADGREQ